MVDWTKPIQTRGGQAARYVGTLNTDNGLRHLVVVTGNAGEFAVAVNEDGQNTPAAQSSADIINVPASRSVWVVLYKVRDGMIVYSEAFMSIEYMNDFLRGSGRVPVAKMKVDITEGFGL